MKKLFFMALLTIAPFLHAQEILLKTDKDWEGKPLPSGKTVTIKRITVPGLTANNWHTHPYDFCGYLEKGTMLIITEFGKEKIVNEGQAICEVTDRLHYGTNLSIEPAKIIIFEYSQ